MTGREATRSITVEVRYFGPLLDETGVAHETIELELPARVHEIDSRIRALRTGLAACTYRLAVDESLKAADDLVTEAREIALLPPFSGG